MSTQKKAVAAGTVILLVANIVLFAMGKISTMTFWGVIILGALVAKFAVPKL